ncbi:MAG: domain S-box [Proteobacteria bacterium]|nr:domain S-box [Pseudomonadota bacterium]
MSQQVHQDAALQDETYFRLVDAVSTPIMLHRANHIIYGNAAFQKLMGCSMPEEMLSMPYFEMGYGEWRDILRLRGEARLRGEKVDPVYEFRLNTRHGEECWVEITASKIDMSGQPTIFCSLVDLTDRKRAENAQRDLQQLLTQIIDSDPVATFVINTQHQVTHWNRACALLTGLPSEEVTGTGLQWKPFYPVQRDTMADVLLRFPSVSEVVAHYPDASVKVSEIAPGAYEGEGMVDFFKKESRWIFFTAALLRDAQGQVFGAVEKIQDLTERRRAEKRLLKYQTRLEQLVDERTLQLGEANILLQRDVTRRESMEIELRHRNEALTQLNARVSQAQAQLLQSEKMASIGQLAAGVAHEINNPIGYVQSNIGTLENYLNSLFRMLSAYEAATSTLEAADQVSSLKALREQIDIDFIQEDIPQLMRESREGITRVSKIVQNLKDFSRTDSSDEWQLADLHQCLDSTISIATNEVKYRADIVKEYGTLPDIDCLPSQLNQVFLNLLVNAAQAMGEARGKITIRTGAAEESVWLEFTDNGSGMSEEVRQKIFDPFFTTKPVGKGTGLGLSMSYGIIQKHHGTITVSSKVGVGTTFRIVLPIHQLEKGIQQEAT